MAEASSSRTPDSSSSFLDCPICLQPLKEESYLDQCFHAFCYQCILRWFSVVSNRGSKALSSFRCPLCKSESLSIVYGFNGETFQRHYVNQRQENGKLRPKYYSCAHERRMQCYKGEAERLKGIFDVQQYWKSHKYLKKNNLIQIWLKREIQALTQDEDVEIIVLHIAGLLESFFKSCREQRESSPEQRREEFRSLLDRAARPFLFGYTERFCDELELFLASGLNVEAYDKVCMQHLALASPNEPRYNNGEFFYQTLQDHFLHFLDEDIDAND